MHTIGALVVSSIAGGLVVIMSTPMQVLWKSDDVLGVRPLHGPCGSWGGVAFMPQAIPDSVEGLEYASRPCDRE
jgi:ammonia channel protein AmtB